MDVVSGFHRSDLDGSNVEQLSPDRFYHFSIDFTNRRVYSGVDGHIHVRNFDGSDFVDIAAPGHPTRFAFDNQPQIPAVSGLSLGVTAVLLILAGVLVSRKQRRNESEDDA